MLYFFLLTTSSMARAMNMKCMLEMSDTMNAMVCVALLLRLRAMESG